MNRFMLTNARKLKIRFFMLINAKDLKNSLFASDWDAFNSLIPYFGQKIFRTSDWTARKTPAWFLTDEWKFDASGLYASGLGSHFHMFSY